MLLLQPHIRHNVDVEEMTKRLQVGGVQYVQNAGVQDVQNVDVQDMFKMMMFKTCSRCPRCPKYNY